MDNKCGNDKVPSGAPSQTTRSAFRPENSWMIASAVDFLYKIYNIAMNYKIIISRLFSITKENMFSKLIS